MATGHSRVLLVVADDFGIGPATTAGILHLARQGIVTASVMLVNSPYAADAVTAWRRGGKPMDLGWHPNLTLDSPILPPAQVPSLVDADGKFWPLPHFLRRWLLGRMDRRDIAAEFRASSIAIASWSANRRRWSMHTSTSFCSRRWARSSLTCWRNRAACRTSAACGSRGACGRACAGRVSNDCC